MQVNGDDDDDDDDDGDERNIYNRTREGERDREREIPSKWTSLIRKSFRKFINEVFMVPSKNVGKM